MLVRLVLRWWLWRTLRQLCRWLRLNWRRRDPQPALGVMHRKIAVDDADRRVGCPQRRLRGVRVDELRCT